MLKHCCETRPTSHWTILCKSPWMWMFSSHQWPKVRWLVSFPFNSLYTLIVFPPSTIIDRYVHINFDFCQCHPLDSWHQVFVVSRNFDQPATSFFVPQKSGSWDHPRATASANLFFWEELIQNPKKAYLFVAVPSWTKYQVCLSYKSEAIMCI